MSERTATPEYNLFYQEDDAFEFETWTTLDRVEAVRAALGKKRSPVVKADFEKARIVRRWRVTIVEDWEFLDEGVEEADADAQRLLNEMASALGTTD